MKKPSLLVIFLTVFIDLIGFGIVLPMIPRYSELYGARGYEIGLVISSFSVMQFLFAPAWGRLSDRIGRRPVLLIGNAGSAISYALFAVSASYTGQTGLILLLASRIFAGVCGATLSVASAYIADITTPETRSKGMGLIGMAFGLGFILGPALGSFSASHFGLSGPGWTAAAFCTMNFLLASVILLESRKSGVSPAAPISRWSQTVKTLRMPRVGFLIGLFFLATFCFTCFESTLPLLLDRKFKYDEKASGYVFAFCGLVAAFVQGGVIGRLIKALGEPKLIAISLWFVALSLVLIPWASTVGMLLAVLAVFAAASGVNRAPTMGLISINAPAEEQGAVLGIAQSAGTLARIAGPLVATSLFEGGAWRPYALCAATALVAGVLAWHWLCRNAAVVPAVAPTASQG